MYRTVIKVFAKHPADWNTVPSLVTAVTKLKSATTQLEKLASQQGNSIVGVKAIKEKEKLKAIERADLLANAIRALAADSKEPGLREQVKFSVTDLKAASGQLLKQLFDRIREKAEDHAPQLADYGITQQQIDDFANDCDQLNNVLGSTRDAIVNRTQQTIAIKDLLLEVDTLLKESIDRQVKVLRSIHPDFFNLYQSARIIVDKKGKGPHKDEPPGLSPIDLTPPPGSTVPPLSE